MYKGLYEKFTQNSKLKSLLLSTSNKKIVEHTKHDSYWGDGKGKGKNILGILLMRLREELRE